MNVLIELSHQQKLQAWNSNACYRKVRIGNFTYKIDKNLVDNLNDNDYH